MKADEERKGEGLDGVNKINGIGERSRDDHNSLWNGCH